MKFVRIRSNDVSLLFGKMCGILNETYDIKQEMDEMKENKIVDAMGKACPLPVVMAKKILDHAAEGEVVEVHVDNEIAVRNLEKLAKNQQSTVRSEAMGEKHFVVYITAGGAETAGGKNMPEEAYESCDCMPPVSHTVVVLRSSSMGNGSEELGKTLMKGFIYALTQLNELPEKVICYNGGVFLTTEGSDSLEDLKLMASQGVEIYSCGTCLNYYGLTDKLQVGEVTNMYSIVEMMAGASKIICP